MDTERARRGDAEKKRRGDQERGRNGDEIISLTKKYLKNFLNRHPEPRFRISPCGQNEMLNQVQHDKNRL